MISSGNVRFRGDLDLDGRKYLIFGYFRGIWIDDMED